MMCLAIWTEIQQPEHNTLSMGKRESRVRNPDLRAILEAAENAIGLRRKEFCTNTRSRALVLIKEAIIVIGDENGMPHGRLQVVLRGPFVCEQMARRSERKNQSFWRVEELLKAMRSGMVRL
jgi:hypothetical protein